MTTYSIGLSGPGARGARVGGALLRDLLAVLVDGVTQSVRLRLEGRSTAQGTLPAWLERAAAFDVLGLESGSTKLLIEAPRLIDAAPDAFAQGHLFSEIDATRTGYDLLTESLTDVVEGKTDSDRYDDRLIRTFESFALVLRHGLERVELRDDRLVWVDPAAIATCRQLRRAIPPDQHARIAGKLDVLRHSDRTFTLIVESGAAIRGVVAGDAIDLPLLATLWGRPAQVSGVAKFRPSGAVLRIDAERIEPASTEDLALWSLEPVPAFGPHDERALVRAQGPRSGVSAVFGQLRDVEEDDAAIIKALDELS